MTPVSPSVDLVWLGGGPRPAWTLGRVFESAATAGAIAGLVEGDLRGSAAGHWLFWDASLGPPDAAAVAEAALSSGDLWHAGLALGLGGQPRMLDYVAPIWMLHRDPDPSIEATSWRLSLRACLMKSDVLPRIGPPRSGYQSLEGASLELGHRCVTRGVLTRHVPTLLPPRSRPAAAAEVPLEDEVRFLAERYGIFWARWAVLRAILTRETPAASAVSALRAVARERRAAAPAPYHADADPPARAREARVTILIPTVDRYPYLRKLLGQLRLQTTRPVEIVIVDQTAPGRRDLRIEADFADLPLRVFRLDRAGQCSSRNAGLEESRGDHILFLDDDDEVAPDLIERHLRSLSRFRAEVSCGVNEEVGAGPLSAEFRLVRASDVFPTNNSLIERRVLLRSGLFDLAYDRGARADRDLGMRLYLSGALMVLHPGISVIHHHAPSGGLRTHGARVVTFASSKGALSQRHLPAPTEIYLARRYFTARQVRESLWLRAVGTVRGRGSALFRAAKMAAGLGMLPSTLLQIRRRSREADRMIASYPRIPRLGRPAARTESGA